MRRKVVALAALAVACATPLPDIQPGEVPHLDSDEAGFWMTMGEVEKDIATSGSRIRNPALESYLQGVVCRIAEDYCSATRVYVVRQADFNASMAPNGTLVVWSGLFLRVQNESQLAAVLAHEMGHYQRRHTLARYRAVRDTTNALMVLTLLAGGIAPSAVNTATLVGMAALMHYSRSQESEADSIGLKRVAIAGYDPREASRIWEGVIREAEAEDEGPEMGFTSTHPSPRSRLERMQREAQQLVTERNTGVVRVADYDSAVAPLRSMLLSDEITMRRHERTEVVIQRLVEADLVSGADAAFFRGELCRVRGKKGDDALAVQHYRESFALGMTMPIAYRNLGIVLKRIGDLEGARASLERYRELDPDASDGAVIESVIQEISR